MTTNDFPHQKSLRFRLEADDAIATLESALAIVRRLGIELASLRTGAGAQGIEVQMRLHAGEEEALLLCRMRLNNVVGILGVREMPALVARLA